MTMIDSDRNQDTMIMMMVNGHGASDHDDGVNPVAILCLFCCFEVSSGEDPPSVKLSPPSPRQVALLTFPRKTNIMFHLLFCLAGRRKTY